jgi:hypothetical protein
MAFAVPLMLINTFFAWVWLCILQVEKPVCTDHADTEI